MTRADIARNAADLLAAADPAAVHACIGLDGFVDEICAVVDTRTSQSAYTQVDTIATLAKKIAAAAGQSSNYELVVKQMKLGGNGPIMANALAAAGFNVTYVGAVGYPTVHPVFAELASRARMLPVCDPGHTDAVEFADGKLMLGKLTPLADLTWDRVVERVGVQKLIDLFEPSRLIAMNNWTMIPNMSGFLEGLTRHVLPKLSKGPAGVGGRTFFVDLADPEKRTRDDLLAVLNLLSAMGPYVHATLGLNLKESDQVAEVLGLPSYPDSEPFIEERAIAIRAKLNLACVVIHPRKGAAAATVEGSAKFAGPFIQHPKLSTGAGDNFNAGFSLARTLGLPLAESLAAATATSGFYVREARSPAREDLLAFLRALPDPQ